MTMQNNCAIPADIGEQLHDFVSGLEHTNRVLELAIARLSAFDERLARNRAEAREAALRSGESWPFSLSR
jgi:hypothetical protein